MSHESPPINSQEDLNDWVPGNQSANERFGTPAPQTTGAEAIENESDERGTPRQLINEIRTTNNGYFEFDLAAGAEPEPIAAIRLTKSDDSLTSSWNADDYPNDQYNPGNKSPVVERSAWLNPPFSARLITQFAEKVSTHMETDGYLDYIVFVSNALSVTTDWYQDYILPHAEYVCFPDHRIEYHEAGSNPDFSTIITTIGETPPQYVEYFQQKGRALEVIEQTQISEDLYDFITDSVHAHTTSNSTDLISTEYRTGEPILNNVGRGDALELTLHENTPRGFPSITTDSIIVRVETWKDHTDQWEILCSLNETNSPFDVDCYLIITVQKGEASSFTVSYQLDNHARSWQPMPVKNIRTITNRTQWNNTGNNSQQS